MAENTSPDPGQYFHVVAILKRNNTIIKIGTNVGKTNPRMGRRFKDNKVNYTLHAEMNVLRFARPGDVIYVYRFLKNGTPSMAKPCAHCHALIKKTGISKVYYTDWDGQMRKYRV